MFAVANPLGEIEDRDIFARSPHEYGFLRIGHLEAREVGMTLHQEPPCVLPLGWIGDRFGSRSRINRLKLFKLLRFAAVTSALTFTAGASAPLLAVLLAPAAMLVPAVVLTSLVFLAVLGGVGARAGAAPIRPAITRVKFWGVVAMAVTAGAGRLFGTTVGLGFCPA